MAAPRRLRQLPGEFRERRAVVTLVDARVVHEQARGGVHGERLDGVEGRRGRREMVVAAALLEGVAEVGEGPGRTLPVASSELAPCIGCA